MAHAELEAQREAKVGDVRTVGKSQRCDRGQPVWGLADPAKPSNIAML